jgi:hypothetical protein
MIAQRELNRKGREAHGKEELLNGSWCNCKHQIVREQNNGTLGITYAVEPVNLCGVQEYVVLCSVGEELCALGAYYTAFYVSRLFFPPSFFCFFLSKPTLYRTPRYGPKKSSNCSKKSPNRISVHVYRCCPSARFLPYNSISKSSFKILNFEISNFKSSRVVRDSPGGLWECMCLKCGGRRAFFW